MPFRRWREYAAPGGQIAPMETTWMAPKPGLSGLFSMNTQHAPGRPSVPQALEQGREALTAEVQRGGVGLGDQPRHGRGVPGHQRRGDRGGLGLAQRRDRDRLGRGRTHRGRHQPGLRGRQGRQDADQDAGPTPRSRPSTTSAVRQQTPGRGRSGRGLGAWPARPPPPSTTAAAPRAATPPRVQPPGLGRGRRGAPGPDSSPADPPDRRRGRGRPVRGRRWIGHRSSWHGLRGGDG